MSVKLIHEEKVYEETSNEYFASWKPVEDLITAAPAVSWLKSPISLKLWDRIKNICLFTNQEHKSECLIRLYFNPELDEWGAHVHPQEMSGMSVKDKVEDLPDTPFFNGAVPAGSLHHHCNSSAFQSGIDHDDEANTSGLHITLGDIGSSEWNIHSRYTIEKIGFQEVQLSSFIEYPSWFSNFENRKFALDCWQDWLLLRPSKIDETDPWINNIFKKTYTYSKVKGRSGCVQSNLNYYGDSYVYDSNSWNGYNKHENQLVAIKENTNAQNLNDIEEDLKIEEAVIEIQNTLNISDSQIVELLGDSKDFSEKQKEQRGIVDAAASSHRVKFTDLKRILT
tara:strand:- start:1491 stop:2504 length:1014 start_codon:yes stop_codon:yes gene_type:complete